MDDKRFLAFKSEMAAAKAAIEVVDDEEQKALRNYITFLRGCYHGSKFHDSTGSKYRRDGFTINIAKSLQAGYAKQFGQYGIGNINVEEFWTEE